MNPSKPIDIDGATGEGGGQLVRLAVALSAVTMQPIRIRNIRANRPRGGGLKSQHFTAIQWLADASGATVTGLEVGSSTLEFSPHRPPTALAGRGRRQFKIVSASDACSGLLVLQAVLPFLLFAGQEREGGGEDANDDGDDGDGDDGPLEVEIHAGTHVSFSPRWEYLDQVLLPALRDRFGIRAEGELVSRGWGTGPPSRGVFRIRIHPLRPGQTLKSAATITPMEAGRARRELEVVRIDASIIAPAHVHRNLQDALAHHLAALFPAVDLAYPVVEDSGHDSRLYVLLVAHSPSLRWASDTLTSIPKKNKKASAPAEVASRVAREVSRELFKEAGGGLVRGEVDVHLQDQLVCFQALAEGMSTVVRGSGKGGQEDEMQALEEGLERMRLREGLGRDKTGERGQFGVGSMHTRTARWVVSELLPAAKFYNRGTVCQGAAVSSPSRTKEGT